MSQTPECLARQAGRRALSIGEEEVRRSSAIRVSITCINSRCSFGGGEEKWVQKDPSKVDFESSDTLISSLVSVKRGGGKVEVGDDVEGCSGGRAIVRKLRGKRTDTSTPPAPTGSDES